jgi:Trk K+ transport system NAD-binding subunit
VTRDWTGHVIVCGLHGVGLRTIEQLIGADVRVVVVDDEPTARLVAQVERWGVPYLTRSAKLPETLEEAGLAGAQAVVVVESEELDTLEVALLVRRLRTDVRIAVAMANEAVGRAVASVTGAGSVLDVASLAAPSIVEACLQDPVHELDMPGERFVAARTVAPRQGRLRDLYGDLAPVGVIDRDTGHTEVCPGRDHVVPEGASVLLVGTPAELEAGGVSISPTPVQRMVEARRARWRQLRRFGSSVVDEADTALRLALVAAVLLVLLCTAVLWAFYRPVGGGHLDPLHALYFALATVATVGFGDYSFSNQPLPMVGFGIFMIVAGAVTITTVLALITNLVLSRRLAGSLRRHEAQTYRGHVIVVGLGSIGVRVVQGLLAAGREVVVVERDESNRFALQVRGLGVPIVVGDATLEGTLVVAGLRGARAIAVLTSDDMINIETGLVAREVLAERWEHVPVVLRVFDRQLGQTVRDSFQLRFVRSTADLAAPWFVGAALGLEVLGTFSVAREHLLLGRLRVARGGGLDGVAMGELSSRTRVVALDRARGGLEHPVRRETRFAPGDCAYIVGPPDDVISVLRREAS